MNENQIDTEKLILNAAEAEFLEKGYAAARTTVIAKRAGVTNAMLHYYFRTKENLFELIFKYKLQNMFDIIFYPTDNDLPFRDKVKLWIEAHFDFFSENRSLPIFIFSEIVRNERLMELFASVVRDNVHKAIANLSYEIDKEVKLGKIKPIAPLDVIYTIVSMNMFVFIGSPFFSTVMGLKGEPFEEFIQSRKAINVELVLNRIFN